MKQDIWSGDSHVTIPVKAPKKFWTKAQRDMAEKFKSEYQQTGRISSVVGKMGVSFVTHYAPAVIQDAISRIGLGAATQCCYLYRMDAYLTLLNQDVNDVTVWIYTLILRNDIGGVGLNPPNDWLQGIVDETGAATDYVQPNSTPFQSKKFTGRWKVHKVDKFVLSSGAQHIHHILCKPYHKVNQERFTNTNSSAAGTGGAINGINYLTSATMIVTQGGLVNDQTTKTNVSYGQTAVDFAISWRYQFHGLQDDNTKYYNPGTGLGAITTASLIQEKTGAVITDTNA